MRKSPVRRAIGYFAFLFLTYSQTSCLEAEEKPVNFGPEVNAADVMKILREPMGKMDHNQIRKGEKFEETFYAYATNNPDDRFIISVKTREVLSRTEMADRIRYVSKIKLTEYKDGNPQTSEANVEEDYAKFDDGSEDTVALAEAVRATGFNTFATGTNKVTYHQLQFRDDIRDLPSKVKDKTNCANVPDCKMKVRVVTVVAAEWTAPGKAVKHDLGFIVSGDAPYYSKLLANCDTSFQNLGKGNPVLVTLCKAMTDFDYGAPWFTEEGTETP